MYIVAQDGTAIVHSDYPIKVVEATQVDFDISDPSVLAGYLVVSIIGDEEVEILGSYDTKEAAILAIKDIVRALGKETLTYQMPSSKKINTLLQKEAFNVVQIPISLN